VECRRRKVVVWRGEGGIYCTVGDRKNKIK